MNDKVEEFLQIILPERFLSQIFTIRKIVRVHSPIKNVYIYFKSL